jgi:hypothetical protein
MKNQWLDEVKKRLQEESSLSSDVRFDRLREQGIIDEHGEVTGHLHRWDAFLAITEVKHANGAQKIAVFRCLKPVFGMPGSATIDVSRETMLDYLRQGKKVITARWDDRLQMWKEDCEVRLLPSGFIRADVADDTRDDIGNVPELSQSNSKL